MEKVDCESNKLKESQALDQFKEWIEKHPKIKKCRTDDQFLIRFLRVRKFNILEACQLLEKYLTSRKQLPHVFDNLNIEAPDIESLVTNHIAFPLSDVDSQGRKIIFVDFGKIDAKRLDAVDLTKMTNISLEHLSFNEISQTKGIVLVIDTSSENYELLRLCTPMVIKEFARCLEKTFPVLVKKIYLVNMAPLWYALLQLIKVFLSDKMKSRFEIMKGWDEMFKELGTKNLPQEVGGQIPASELAEAYRKHLLENQENILSISDSDIEISNSSRNFTSSYDTELDAGIVGSFRKIALD